MGQKKLRGRGPEPELCDSEVLTMEIVGEFLGIDSEKGLYAYFKRHYGEWFPALGEVHRTTFTRQMAYPCGSPRSGCGESFYAGSASIRGSPWWTPSRCPLVVSPVPIAAEGWPRSRLSVTTR